MKRSFALLLILPLASFLFPSNVHGEVNALGEIDTVEILMDITEDAKKCSVTEAGIKTAAEFPIATSQLQMSTGQVAYYINVNVIFMGSINHCIYNVGITVYDVQDSYDKHFWGLSKLGIISQGRAGKEIYGVVEEITKMFVVDWIQAVELGKKSRKGKI